MIEIKIVDEAYDESDVKLYDFDGLYVADEDCPSWGVVEMFAQAMRTAGYTEKNILDAMYNYALEYAHANGIDLREEL